MFHSTMLHPDTENYTYEHFVEAHLLQIKPLLLHL